MIPRFDSRSLSGMVLDQKYDVGELVAWGGFGLVYKATHRALRKTVAIKVLSLHQALSEDDARAFLEAFGREAQIVASLEHPAIVKVLDFGTMAVDDGGSVPWMAMEWIEGETLESNLAHRRGRRGRTPDECLQLLRPVLEALAEAHDRGFAHRDLKPANLMVVDRDLFARKPRPAHPGFAPVRLLDFGIAKIMAADERVGTGATHTRRGASMTPHYAAPEQIAGTRTGPWTDVHSMGLIFTELLINELPYGEHERDDVVQVLKAALAEPRPTPARFGVDVGPWEPVLARALALKATERYADATELLYALEGALGRSVRGTSWTPSVPRVALAVPISLAPVERSRAPETARGPRRVTWIACLAFAILAGAVSAKYHPRPGATAHAASAPLRALSRAPARALSAPPPTALTNVLSVGFGRAPRRSLTMLGRPMPRNGCVIRAYAAP